jgi:hypothetical protein
MPLPIENLYMPLTIDCRSRLFLSMLTKELYLCRAASRLTEADNEPLGFMLFLLMILKAPPELLFLTEGVEASW